MRLTARERQLSIARRQIESDLALSVYRELAVLWRRLYPSLKRLERQRPKMIKQRLHKAVFAGDTSLWQSFEDKLEQKIRDELASGGITLDQIHAAYDKYRVEEQVNLIPEELIEANRKDIGDRIKNISAKTRSDVGRLVSSWYDTPGSTMADLVDDLKPLFSEKRAASIAATETTHINSMVVRSRMEKQGLDDWWWQTKRDEIVCNLCRSKHGKTFHRNDPMPPEASHPNCRCVPIPIPTKQEAAPPSPPPQAMALAAVQAQNASALLSTSSQTGIGVKQYTSLQHKTLRGGILTPQEISAAEAFSIKTWKGKVQPWIGMAKQWLTASTQPVIPLTVKQYVSLSHKAMRTLLSPSEIMSVEAFAQKTWGKAPVWIGDQKVGALYTKVKVKPKAVIPQTPQPKKAPAPAKPIWQTSSGGLSHDALKQMDLHDAEPTWKNQSSNPRYGVVLIDDTGNVMLRQPKDPNGQGQGYDGYKWTYSKGGQSYAGEHPVSVAERETLEETGYEVEIIGLVPGGYQSGSSSNFFFVARPKLHDPTKMGKETEEVKWFTPAEAVDHINMTTKDSGRKRDQAILQAALDQDAKIRSGKMDQSYLFAGLKPPEPPKPQKPKKKIKAIDIFKPQIGFPASPQKLKPIQHLGGSTGAQLVHDQDSGKKYVMKRGNSAGHLLEEAYADAVYRAAGVNVPDFQVYQTDQGPVKLSAYIDNSRSLANVLSTGSETEKKKVKDQLKKNFASDALLANWDVIGMDADNILVDKNLKVWRIDNGGSLRYRAQGGKKQQDWNEYPDEIWRMRGTAPLPGDPQPGGALGQAVNIFGDMSYSEVGKQMRELAAKRDAILAAVPDEVRKVMEARLDHIEHLGKAQELMGKSGWKEDYQEGFARQLIETRKAGITAKLPEKMTTTKSGEYYDVALKDEKGKKFDSLRGVNSVVDHVEKWINNSGGNYKVISNWMDNQAGSSWSNASQGFKWFIAQEMGSTKDYYWRNGAANARKCYENACSRYGKETFEKSIQMYHAFVYEFLSKTDMPNKNPDGTMRLIRTEPEAVIQQVNAKPGDKGLSAKRGALESLSLLNPVYVGGNHVTEQDIPISNIFGTYLVDRYPGFDRGSFYGDHENEFVAILGKKQAFDFVLR